MQTNLRLPWLLVATPQLMDANFQRTVVLIVEHNRSGSMGFVINRPLRTPVADIVLSSPVPVPSSVPAWYGGPVGTRAGVILHNEAGRIAVSASEKTLLEMIDAAKARLKELETLETPAQPVPGTLLYPYRFVVGYAGWGPGQLDGELRAGAWLQVPATPDLVFATAWTRMWEQALGDVGASPRSLAPTAQPYLN